ncbi:unnamed protein product [Arabidopsis lyrata]|nr:unnamed protein product [Arabidopsis lyrata]
MTKRRVRESHSRLSPLSSSSSSDNNRVHRVKGFSGDSGVDEEPMVHGASSVVLCILPARSPNRNQGSLWRGEASAGRSDLDDWRRRRLYHGRRFGGGGLRQVRQSYATVAGYLRLLPTVLPLSRLSRGLPTVSLVSSSFSSQLYGGGMAMVLCRLLRSISSSWLAGGPVPASVCSFVGRRLRSGYPIED